MNKLSSLARTISRHPNFGGLLAANFALGMAYSFVMPVMSLWGTLEIKMSPLWFGIFMTASTVETIVVSTILARWSDSHLTRRTVLIIGAVGGVLGYVLYGYLKNPLLLFLTGSSALSVASVTFSQLFSHVRETFEESEHPDVDAPFLVSVVRVCFSIAWTVGPSIGATMMGRFGYRGVFLGAAGLYFLFLLGVLGFVPHRPRRAAARHAPSKHQPVWTVITRPDILASSLAFVFVFSAHAMNLMNLPLTVKTVLGGNERDLGIIFGVGPVAEIPLMLWFGHLAARGHQISLIRFGALVTAAYFVLLGTARAPWHIFPMQILSGVSFAILTNVTILFYQDLLPRQMGLGTTIFSNSINLGNLLGYFAFGALVEAVGNRGTFWVCAVLAGVALAILVMYKFPSRSETVNEQRAAEGAA